MFEFEGPTNKATSTGDSASRGATGSSLSEDVPHSGTNGRTPTPDEDSRASTKQATIPRVLLPRETVVPTRLRRLKILPKLLFIVGAAFTYYGYSHKGSLAEAVASSAQMMEDPTQLDIEDGEAFPLNYRGTTYTLEPLADYQFSGLVVTRNDISAFDDIYHTSDSVDVVDLCVVWGSNLDRNLLAQFTFWSEPWSCNYQTESRTAATQFVDHQLSNNHLLPATDGVAAVLSSVRIGDQVRVRGKLVNYYPQGQEDLIRRSSLSRTDSGNGACEVVYVESATILSRGTPWAYRFWEFGITMLLVALLSALVNFFVIPIGYY